MSNFTDIRPLKSFRSISKMTDTQVMTKGYEMVDGGIAMVQDNKNDRLSGLTGLAIRLLCIGATLWICWHYICCFAVVRDEMMYPRLRDGDLTLILKIGHTYAPEDVIWFKKAGLSYMGRVVAVGGDQVEIPAEGGLYVNGALQSEQIFYETATAAGQTIQMTVPEAACYVLADFRTNAVDSRDFGCVSRDEIIGKVCLLFRRRGI